MGNTNLIMLNVQKLLSVILSESWFVSARYAQKQAVFISQLMRGEFTAPISPLRKATMTDMVNRHNDPEWQEFNYYLYGITPQGTQVRVDSYSELPSDSIALIKIHDVMMREDTFCGPMGTRTMGEMVKSADKSSRIKEILFSLDTPGGQAAGTEQLAQIIASTEKPTTSFVETAFSAGYWIASATDRIVMSAQSSEVGSIGTQISFASMKRMFEEMGIDIHTIRATKSPDKNEDFLQAEEGNYERIIENVLDPLNEIFHANVLANRPQVNKEAMTGKTYFAQDAISLGLADEITDFDTFIQANTGHQNHIIMSNFDRLMSLFTSRESTETSLETIESELTERNAEIEALRQANLAQEEQIATLH